jgi:putative DNA primase/helicase
MRETVFAAVAGGGDGEKKKGRAKGPAEVRRVTAGLTRDVILALRGLCMLPESKYPSMPAWLDGPPPFPIGELIAARNGIVHLPSFAENQPGSILPCDPRFFTPVALDYDVVPDPGPPTRFLAFLSSQWGHDPQSIDCLQEMFGYMLTSDASFQKIFAIIGPPRSGKGTIMKVLTAMVGEANVCNPTLNDLTHQFGLTDMVGKRVAIINDARIGGRKDTQTILERMLSISGQDAQRVDRKFREAIKVTLSAKFVIVSNKVPDIKDPSGALISRFVLIKTNKSFAGQEDPRLVDELMSEQPRIFAWAVQGLVRLRDRGRFLQPESGAGKLADLERLTNPIKAFVEDCCEVAPDAQVARPRFYKVYQAWCHEVGRTPMDESHFSIELHEAYPDLGETRLTIDGKRVRFHVGIGLNDSIQYDQQAAGARAWGD